MGISDHNLAYICRKIGIPKQGPKVVEIRQFKNFNICEFQHDLTEAFRHFTFYSDPNTALHEWKEIFYQIADFHAPYRSRKVRNKSCPWLNSGIKNEAIIEITSRNKPHLSK